jgi:hypothetical protein
MLGHVCLVSDKVQQDSDAVMALAAEVLQRCTHADEQELTALLTLVEAMTQNERQTNILLLKSNDCM